MTEALKKFADVDAQFLLLLSAEEVGHPITARTAADYVVDSEEYTIKAEDVIFEAGRYLDKHLAAPLINMVTATPTPTAQKGCKITFRPMTHDDCGLWFMQLDDVFAAQGIVSQVAKFAALTTLLTEEEAYVVRDLTMLGDARRVTFLQRPSGSSCSVIN